jgi:hypothetical protein
MRRSVPSLLAAAIVGISACSPADSGTPSPSGLASSAPSTPASAAHSFSAEPSVAALTQDCTNGTDGFTVSFPADWYTNPPDCWLFAPTPFQVVTDSEISSDVAIVIRRVDEWEPETFDGRNVLSEDELEVDGLPTRIQEIEITEGSLAFARGDRLTEYVVSLPDGAFIVADTYGGPDYEEARSVLEDMIGTLQINTP